jgi:predicted nucleic acid-binding protein
MTVVDANVLFKLVAKEKHSEKVREIFLKKTSVGEPMEAPDIAVSEVLNALWKSYVLKKSMSAEGFEYASRQLDLIIAQLNLIPASDLKDIALKIAVEKRITVYDSMYIAASILKGSPLLSYDEELLGTASGLGVMLER